MVSWDVRKMGRYSLSGILAGTFTKRRLSTVLVFLFLLSLAPARASPEGFPDSMPYLEKDEYSRFGLVQSLLVPGDKDFYDPIYNRSWVKQSFECAKTGRDYWFEPISVFIEYRPGNKNRELFANYRATFQDTFKDNKAETWDDYGNLIRVQVFEYEIIEWSDRVLHWKLTLVDKAFDTNGKITRGSVWVTEDYRILSGNYIVSVTVRYITEAYGLDLDSYDEYTACDIQAIAPEIIDLFLAKIPDNDVQVGDSTMRETSTDSTTRGETDVSTPKNTVLTPQSAGEPLGKPRVELNDDAKFRMEKTRKTLLSFSGEKLVLKTPEGEIVTVYNPEKAETAIGFKLKYYASKLLDSAIDSASNYLPSPVGLFKDYVKADKDVSVFTSDDLVKKTATDLHVNERSASLYNDMNAIDEREKPLSPAKNAVPTSIATKPLESLLNAMGVAIKKTLAQNYEWEYRKAAEAAIEYKKAGMKYRDIIRLTIRKLDEETFGMNRVNMLDRNSKGDFRSQEARVRFYINKLFEEGKI